MARNKYDALIRSGYTDADIEELNRQWRAERAEREAAAADDGDEHSSKGSEDDEGAPPPQAAAHDAPGRVMNERVDEEEHPVHGSEVDDPGRNSEEERVAQRRATSRASKARCVLVSHLELC